MAIDSSVVEAASFAPLHSRKKIAAAYRISMYARWIPMQLYESEPKANNGDFVAEDMLESSSQRSGLKLSNLVIHQ